MSFPGPGHRRPRACSPRLPPAASRTRRLLWGRPRRPRCCAADKPRERLPARRVRAEAVRTAEQTLGPPRPSGIGRSGRRSGRAPGPATQLPAQMASPGGIRHQWVTLDPRDAGSLHGHRLRTRARGGGRVRTRVGPGPPGAAGPRATCAEGAAAQSRGPRDQPARPPPAGDAGRAATGSLAQPSLPELSVHRTGPPRAPGTSGGTEASFPSGRRARPSLGEQGPGHTRSGPV